MNYKTNPKNGDKLSILGYGCMRFPKDEKEAEAQIIYAIENGVNYFDTAYIYPNSETVLGNVLAKGYRERVKIATKLPHYLIKKYEDLDKIFNTQLSRLKTTYVDYYFIHMLSDVKTWQRLVDIGILRWINEKKKSKQIANIGFSYHGGKQEFVNLIDAYDWEFCMIQYNFFDENKQAGKSGLQYAAQKGLAVMVMEPLRGGKLVTNLPKEVYKIWDSAHVKRTPAEWAFRWIWNHPEVSVVLSGMNTMAIVEENIRVASDAEPNSLSAEDLKLFDKVNEIFAKSIKVPCTACNYCMPCPVGVDIPTCFAIYNDREVEGKGPSLMKYIMQTSMKSKATNASLCVKCGKCEEHCPQNIAIRNELVTVTKKMESFYYKPIRFGIKKFMKFKD